MQLQAKPWLCDISALRTALNQPFCWNASSASTTAATRAVHRDTLFDVAQKTGQAPSVELWVLLALTLAALVSSGIAPYDRLTWSMEVSWVAVGLPLLVVTRRRFPLTPLLYRLLFLHALILIMGGYYTYARTPVGFWFADLFGLARNNYDRLGHLVQGFVPAILVREILVRRSPLAGSRWLPVVVVSICLAFSAFFEMIEWWSALILGAGATAYLATQGDPWDTQWDMFLALVGAIAAVATLSRLHDRHLRNVVG